MYKVEVFTAIDVSVLHELNILIVHLKIGKKIHLDDANINYSKVSSCTTEGHWQSTWALRHWHYDTDLPKGHWQSQDTCALSRPYKLQFNSWSLAHRSTDCASHCRYGQSQL